MSKAAFILNLLSKNKKKKKRNNLILILLAGGTFFSLLIIVAIIFFLIFLPFVGVSFFNKVNSEADDAMNAAQLSMKDPMDNKGFVEDLKKSIEYGDDWEEILAALQSKRMIYSSDKIKIEDSANAVKTGTVTEWLQSTPPGGDPNIVKNMDTEEFDRTFEHNKRTIRYNVGPYIGRKNIEEIKTIPLNGGKVDKWKYDSSLGYLSFDIIAKDGTRVPYEFYGVGKAKVYPDLESANAELKDPALAKKYAESVVILQTSKDPSGKLGIIVNFPLDKGVKVEDKDITSAIGLLSDSENANNEPEIPLRQTPDEAGMASYIKTKLETPVIIPENVKVLKTYYDNKTKYGVILQSLDNERRYKFENLSSILPEFRAGQIYISNPGGSVAFGKAGSDGHGGGLVKMNTYVNFKLIFKEDYEEDKGSPTTTGSSIENDVQGGDPAVSGGFNEVDSYKAALIMKESRVKTGQQQGDANQVFPPEEGT